jgi:lipoprotein signal peptidase
MMGQKNVVKIGVVAGSIFLLDQITKFFATQADIVTLNTGISFRFLEQLPAWVWVACIVLLLIFLIRTFWTTWQRFPVVSGIFFGGVIANGVDRVFWGGVRDFLPFFGLRNNIADYAIVGGLVVLVALQMGSKQNH